MSNPTVEGLAACTTLHNGVEMPWVGLGTWQSKADEAYNAVLAALEVGYRHIDTAAIYGNEEAVGRALAESGVDREQVFVTTKVFNEDIKAGRAREALEESLARLGLEVVDLVLLHWPVGGRIAAWQALERAYRDGLARAIGVSNFMIHHLEELRNAASVTPMVDQVEFHPHLVQPELLTYCREHGIQHEGWSPLMQGRVGEVETIQRIAAGHGKTPAQVAIRWALQHESVTIPKSVRRQRIAENADVFDFELTAAEMTAIDALDRSERLGPDPDEMAAR